MKEILTLDNIFGYAHETGIPSNLTPSKATRGVRHLFKTKQIKMHYSFVFFTNKEDVNFKHKVYIAREESKYLVKEKERIEHELSELQSKKLTLSVEEKMEYLKIRLTKHQGKLNDFNKIINKVEAINKRVS